MSSLRLMLSWGHSQEAEHLSQQLGDPVQYWATAAGLRDQVYRADKEAREGEGPAEQEGLRRLPNMALLSGTSLLPCLISQPLSQPDDCNCSGAQEPIL